MVVKILPDSVDENNFGHKDNETDSEKDPKNNKKTGDEETERLD